MLISSAKFTAERLAGVQAKLDGAIASLINVRFHCGPNEHTVLMEEAVAFLEAVSGRWQREKEIERLTPGPPLADVEKKQIQMLLHSIQTRVCQLQRLNDTGVRLCRGWLAAAPRPVDGYGYSPNIFVVSTHEPNGHLLGAEAQ
jgi:hypothetical protein